MDSQVPGNGCVGQFLATVGLGTADRGLASGGTQQRGLLPSVPAGDSYLSSYWSELICRLFLLVYCLQFQQVFLNSFPIGLEFICRLFLLARKEVYCLQFQQVFSYWSEFICRLFLLDGNPSLLPAYSDKLFFCGHLCLKNHAFRKPAATNWHTVVYSLVSVLLAQCSDWLLFILSADWWAYLCN